MPPLFSSKYSPFLFVFVFVFVFVFLSMPINAPCAGGKLSLSDTEIQWIKDHRVITIAPDPDFPPIDFFDSKGTYKGIAADYIESIEEK
ncbi:MAG: hypothetical protein U9P80_02685, partial [Thermodesulfobacteriota bacterium]|nr:hypothetical protein [Thermodesulfobacteriota bacterium]